MRSAAILLVGSNRLSRAGLTRLLADSPFAVTGEIADGAMIGPMFGSGRITAPDIVIVDFANQLDTALAALGVLGSACAETPVLVLQDRFSLGALSACLGAGARGYLTRDVSADALLQSLRLIALGETVFPSFLANVLAGGPPDVRISAAQVIDSHGLSGREVETVRCLLRGDSNKLIARRLRITEATIKVHMKSVLRKINVTNRTQAAIWAHSHGFLPPLDVPAVFDDESRVDANL